MAADTAGSDGAPASPEAARAAAYTGGKGRVYQQIINQIPPHDTYIEAFLGNGSVARAKRPARRTIGIELNPAVLAAHWRGDELPDLTVVCGDVFALLASYRWQGGEFVYLDPPYLAETRSSQRSLYQCELQTTEEHAALLELVRQLPCPVAISGYWSEMYARELASWRTVTFMTTKRSGARAEEWLWMNYPTPLELHDYRYLGDDYRERERIKRKRERWAERLRRQPDQERYALLAAISEVRAEQSPVGNTAGPNGDYRRAPPEPAV